MKCSVINVFIFMNDRVSFLLTRCIVIVKDDGCLCVDVATGEASSNKGKTGDENIRC